MRKHSYFFTLLFLSSLILLSFFPGCSGCLPTTPVTVTGTIYGYVALPDNTAKDLTGYTPIAGATVTIVDADGVTHTVITDQNGYYCFNNINVKANTIINITKDTEGGGKLIFKDIVPLVVSVEEDYDAGIADVLSTATALVVEELVNLGQVQEEIDLDEITSSDGFDELKEDVQQAQEDNQDINTDNHINAQAEEIADNIVNPPLDHFTVTGYPISTTAGQNFGSNNIVVTAYDGNNKIKTDYTGEVYFTSTDTSAILPYTSGSKYTFTAGDNGIHTFLGTGFTLNIAGTKTITLTDGTVSITSNDITVTPGALHHIVISPDTATITAGQTQVYTAEAFDAANNSLGDVTASTTFAIDAGAGGSWSTNTYTSATAGDWTVTGTYSGKTDTASLTVNSGTLHHIVISPDTATITAGQTQVYTAEAFDAANNSLGDVTASTTFAIDAGAGGSWSTNTYTSATAGDWTVTGTYSGKTDTASLTVTAGAATSFVVTTQHSGTETAGTSFSVTVTAKDADGNTATGYTGVHSITWTWTATNSPDNTAPTKPANGNQNFTNGAVTVAGFTLTNSGETPTITAAADVSGTTFAITVNDGSLNYVKVESAAGGTGSEVGDHSMTADQTFVVHAAGYDAYGNYKNDESVTWTGTGVCSGNLTTPGTSTTFTPVTAGDGTIVIADYDSITGDTTGTITVTAGAAASFVVTTQHSGTETAGTSFSVTVTAKDADGNTATGYTGVHSITWTWTATNSPDNTAPTKPANGNQNFTNGAVTVAGFTLTNSGETPTITATAGSVSGTTSAITVTAGTKNKLLWVTQPASPVTVGATWTAFTIEITDVYGNRTSDTDNITIAASGSGTLGGTLTQAAVNGLATFNNITYDTVEAITITGSAAGLADTPVSNEVTINPLAVGDSYGGGKVAYIFVDGDPGYDANVQHGLIAATADQSTGTQWYNGSYVATGATATAIGTGQANTTAIVNTQGVGSYAAQLCNDLTEGGYSDWFLPSKDELNKLYINKDAIGGFAGTFYWSSSEVNADHAWTQSFYNGSPDDFWKFSTLLVRAVRAF